MKTKGQTAPWAAAFAIPFTFFFNHWLMAGTTFCRGSGEIGCVVVWPAVLLLAFVVSFFCFTPALRRLPTGATVLIWLALLGGGFIWRDRNPSRQMEADRTNRDNESLMERIRQTRGSSPKDALLLCTQWNSIIETCLKETVAYLESDLDCALLKEEYHRAHCGKLRISKMTAENAYDLCSRLGLSPVYWTACLKGSFLKRKVKHQNGESFEYYTLGTFLGIPYDSAKRLYLAPKTPP